MKYKTMSNQCTLFISLLIRIIIVFPLVLEKCPVDKPYQCLLVFIADFPKTYEEMFSW